MDRGRRRRGDLVIDPILLALGIGGLVIGTVTFARKPNWVSAALVYLSAALVAFSFPGGC